MNCLVAFWIVGCSTANSKCPPCSKPIKRAPGIDAVANSALEKSCRVSSVAWKIKVGARIAAILSFGILAVLSNAAPAERGTTGFIWTIYLSTRVRWSKVNPAMTTLFEPISAMSWDRKKVLIPLYNGSCLKIVISISPWRLACAWLGDVDEAIGKNRLTPEGSVKPLQLAVPTDCRDHACTAHFFPIRFWRY